MLASAPPRIPSGTPAPRPLIHAVDCRPDVWAKSRAPSCAAAVAAARVGRRRLTRRFRRWSVGLAGAPAVAPPSGAVGLSAGSCGSTSSSSSSTGCSSTCCGSSSSGGSSSSSSRSSGSRSRSSCHHNAHPAFLLAGNGLGRVGSRAASSGPLPQRATADGDTDVERGIEPAKTKFRIGGTDVNLVRWVCRQLEAKAGDSHNGISTCTFLSVPLPDHRDLADRLATLETCFKEESADFVVCADQDLVAKLPDGLMLAAMLPRCDVREAVVTKAQDAGRLEDLPSGARVCVTSVYRRLQLQAQYPHLNLLHSKSALQKRLRRLHYGDYDACIASAATLQRWGFGKAPGELHLLEVHEVMPAFGQGSVGLICQTNDEATLNFLATFDDETSRACIESEMTLSSQLCEDLWTGAVGGLAQLCPDGELRLQCTVAFPSDSTPSLKSARRAGTLEECKGMAGQISTELKWDTIHSLLTGKPSEKGLLQDAETAMVDDEDEEEDDEQSKVLLPLPGFGERQQVEALDTTGHTSYKGRVCMVFPREEGALIDVNCEAPAPPLQWFREQAGSEMAGDNPQWLKLGAEVQVFCFRKERHDLIALFEQPPRLLQRGNAERIGLKELSNGGGPFRAVVMSCTSQGTLVDFNCEVAGCLVDGNYKRGEELRVYCQEVNLEEGTCMVSTRLERTGSRKRVVDLSPGSENAYKGTVQKITNGGAIVDFHCEVNGFIEARDIDIAALPDGLAVGNEVTIYITKLEVARRYVRLSMFRPRPGSTATSGGGRAGRR